MSSPGDKIYQVLPGYLCGKMAIWSIQPMDFPMLNNIGSLSPWHSHKMLGFSYIQHTQVASDHVKIPLVLL